MFYKSIITDSIRVPPKLFNITKEKAVLKQIKQDYEAYISKDLGIVITVSNIEEIKEGIIIPGDGASYYQTKFELLTFKPEMQEVVLGKIKDIADFGAFITLGPTEGMIHISQAMDDFVSFSKDKVLSGKETKRTLKIDDKCQARIIALSFKDVSSPKIGLTMRQEGLGRIEWIEEAKKEKPEENKKEKPAPKEKNKKKIKNK